MNKQKLNEAASWNHIVLITYYNVTSHLKTLWLQVTHMYHLQVSVGQEPRCNLAGSLTRL